MLNTKKDGRRGLDRIIHAAGYSIAGLRSAYVHESAFRQEVWLAIVLLPIAVWISRDWIELVILIGSLFLVLIVELLNSGIEATVDRISLDWHDLSKRAKDLGSAAVFLSFIVFSGTWLLALWHRLHI